MDHHHHHHHHSGGGGAGGGDDVDNEFYDAAEHAEEEHKGGAGGVLFGGGVVGASGGGEFPDEIEKNLDDASNLLEVETGLFHQRMWGCFQSCARAIAQVYVANKSGGSTEHGAAQQQAPTTALGESSHVAPSSGPAPPVGCAVTPESTNSTPIPNKTCSGGGGVEESFKSAAQHATTLYKDSLETSRRLIDLSTKTGVNRRTKEVLAFVKSRKKRFIRKDELISFLTGGGGKVGGGGSGAASSGVAASLAGRKHSSSHHVLGGAGLVTGGGIAEHYAFGHAALGTLAFPIHVGVSPPQPSSASASPAPYQHSSTPPLPLQSGLPPSLFGSSPFQRLSSSSNNNSNSPNSSTTTAASPEEDDPTLLHLAVQQLFVANTSASSSPSSTLLAHHHNHSNPGFGITSGVKRPAPVGGIYHHQPDNHHSADEDDGSSEVSRGPGGMEDGFDDDDMMEDEPGNNNNNSFKRMRFY